MEVDRPSAIARLREFALLDFSSIIGGTADDEQQLSSTLLHSIQQNAATLCHLLSNYEGSLPVGVIQDATRFISCLNKIVAECRVNGEISGESLFDWKVRIGTIFDNILDCFQSEPNST